MEWMDRLTASWLEAHPDWDFSVLPPLVRLTRLSVLMTEFQEQALLPYGLTPSDYSVLAALRRSGGANRLAPSELYSVLEVSSGGMTKMIKRLEARGLVERSPDKGRGSLSLATGTQPGVDPHQMELIVEHGQAKRRGFEHVTQYVESIHSRVHKLQAYGSNRLDKRKHGITGGSRPPLRWANRIEIGGARYKSMLEDRIQVSDTPLASPH